MAHRIPGAQLLDKNDSAREEGDPGDIFGVLLSLALDIGAAF